MEMFVWVMIYYAVFVLLLFSNFTMGSTLEFEADTTLTQVDEADRTSYDDEPSQARSHSQHRFSKERNPNLPGGPGSASTVATTVSGWVFCTACLSVNTPLVGVEAELLCPHPPPGGGGPGRGTTMVQVSSTVTGKDGWYHLTPNASSARIINRCAVIISKSSDSNCDLPPPTGTRLPVPASSTSLSDSDDSSGHHYSVRPFLFSPVSCLVNTTKAAAAVGKPRTLLQDGEDPLGVDPGPEKNHNHKSTKNPVSGSDLHGGEEEPAVVMAHHHHQIKPRSRFHRNHRNKRMKQAPTAAFKLPPFPDKPPRKAMNSRRISSFVKSLMTIIPSHAHLPDVLDTNSRRHHRGGGPPPTLSTDSHRRHHGGPPHSTDSDDFKTNNTLKP